MKLPEKVEKRLRLPSQLQQRKPGYAVLFILLTDADLYVLYASGMYLSMRSLSIGVNSSEPRACEARESFS